MNRIYCNKEELKENLSKLLNEEFNIPDYLNAYDTQIEKHITPLIDDLTIFIESPYVDKVYRDSYYSYFSSKLGSYKRDCIRLSFFNGQIDLSGFESNDGVNVIQSQYLGFMVLRPTTSNMVGRSVISPKALKQNSFLCVSTQVDSTVNFVKLTAAGFPHSSQDTETISCAETTLWAVMEYFGNRYAEYKPTLPSQITSALKKVSAERQVPSKGLNIQQMAYVLKEFGFGTKIYGRHQFGDAEFKRLFSTYIESGIPLIVAIDNRHKKGNIGHAILSVGHEYTSIELIDQLKPMELNNRLVKDKLVEKNINLFDNDDANKKFVFIDDNMPSYCIANLESPALHYPDANWHSCEITFFIVPLYPKIYLEAFEAKKFMQLLLVSAFDLKPNEDIFLRSYLTSSRSYKHELMLNTTFDPNLKTLILESNMPKFIWVCEISTKDLIKNQLASGIILLDATEANTQNFKPLICASYMGSYISHNSVSGFFDRNNLILSPFSIFTGNLKGF